MDIWQVKTMKIGDLVPNAKNPRKISKEKLEALQDKIQRLGFHNPIKVDENLTVLGGNQRLKALLKIAGKDLEVPVMFPNRPLTKEEKDEIIITDNVSDGEWDWDVLTKEWSKELTESWGLNWDECDTVEEKQIKDEKDDDIPETPVEPITKRGDVWILGEHRLMCGDTTMFDDMQKLMEDDVANMVFTDPPYNVNYGATMKDSLRYHAGTLGGRKIMNDNLGDGFAQFLTDSLSNLMMFNKGAAYVCMSSSELHTLYSSFVAAGGKWSTFIIWAKNTFTLGRADYQRQYEPILYGWSADKKHYWCGDRDQSDVWEYNKPVKNDLHPTMKPVELVERAINNSSKLGDIVLDGFGGSGSTLIACEKNNRKARLMELDPKFCDVIVKRWEDYTEKKAELLK